ncbi:hypothetical protein LS684_17090 [Cytobacillus spongiae]|nr:hypothetical protein [Cytobacillus spongiae]UII55329.1 hypothetical protein LS684_17090 [Cytobacillus spongiae]
MNTFLIKVRIGTNFNAEEFYFFSITSHTRADPIDVKEIIVMWQFFEVIL